MFGILKKRSKKGKAKAWDGYGEEGFGPVDSGTPGVFEQTGQGPDMKAKKVLVVGKEEVFEKLVVEYALGLAERMGYEIVALNILPLPTDSPKLAPYCSLISDDFKNKCEESVSHFYELCKEKGIGFEHLVKTGDPEQCIKDVHREIDSIEFVICDPEVCPSMAGEVEGGVIPVFCLANT